MSGSSQQKMMNYRWRSSKDWSTFAHDDEFHVFITFWYLHHFFSGMQMFSSTLGNLWPETSIYLCNPTQACWRLPAPWFPVSLPLVYMQQSFIKLEHIRRSNGHIDTEYFSIICIIWQRLGNFEHVQNGSIYDVCRGWLFLGVWQEVINFLDWKQAPALFIPSGEKWMQAYSLLAKVTRCIWS